MEPGAFKWSCVMKDHEMERLLHEDSEETRADSDSESQAESQAESQNSIDNARIDRLESTYGCLEARIEVNLTHLLASQDLRMVIGRYAGWPLVRSCSALESQLKHLQEQISQVVYIAGGFDGEKVLSSVLRFNPTRQPSQRLQASSESYISDVCVYSKTIEEPSTLPASRGVWEEAAPMAQKRAGFAAASLAGILYVCGGYDGHTFLRSCERFYPGHEEVWESVPSMTQKRHCAAAESLAGRLYVCGGYNGEEALSCVECFNPITNRWSFVEPMSHRRHGAAAAVLNGKLYVCGGYDGEKALFSVEVYDPCKATWEVISPMLHPRNVALAVARQGRIYVCSGCNGEETLDSMESYDPDANVWTLAAPMETCRHGAAAALAGDNLFVCGGGDSAEASGGRLLQDVEHFDFAANRWINTTPMSMGRIDMAAVSLFTPTSASDSKPCQQELHF